RRRAMAGGRAEDSRVAVEGVPHTGEEAALLGQLGDLLAPRLGELAQQTLLLAVELGRGTHVEVDEQVAAPGTAQVRYALATDPQRRARLGARPALDVLLAVERLDGQLGAQRRGGHRYRDPAVQIVALAGEDVVLPLVDLDVQVAGRAAAGT